MSAVQTADDLRATSPGWIVGPIYDLLFFSTMWLPPILVLALDGFTGAARVEFGAGFFVLWIYHLFIRLPHFAAMFRVTYLRTDQFQHYREHWVAYFAIPLAIIAIYAWPLSGPAGYDTSLGFMLTTAGYLWGYQHIGMQNYGVLQIYRLRSEVREPAYWPRLEKGIFYAIIVSVCVSNHLAPVARFVGVVPVGSAHAETASLVFLGVAGLLLLLYLGQLLRLGGLRTPAVLYLLISAAAMVKWPFYDALPAGSWFLVFNGHHSVAYLGLLFLMTWNDKYPDRPFTLVDGVREYAKFFWPLVGFAVLLILVAATYHSSRVTAGYDAPGTGSLEALLGFFVAHYYVESKVWRFRHDFNRRNTLPLLKRPG
jgi:hypothetical protein